MKEENLDLLTGAKDFRICQHRLWNLLHNVDMSDGCKSYEGEIEVNFIFPNFFESPDKIPNSCYCIITLNCYVLGSGRHHDFKGKSFYEAVKSFEAWLDEIERKETDE